MNISQYLEPSKIKTYVYRISPIRGVSRSYSNGKSMYNLLRNKLFFKKCIVLHCYYVIHEVWISPHFCKTLLSCSVTSVVSDPVPPHRWQPIRLPRPWDSPGKNTGVGCISFSNAWKWSRSVVSRLFMTVWIAAYQAPLSVGFSKQEYWSGSTIAIGT